MYAHRLYTIAVITLSFLVHAHEPAVVHLDPAYINKDSILVQSACDRPRRTAGINISREQHNDKTVVHCYGHAGHGFSTFLASAHEAIQLLLDTKPDLQTPVRVIGAGCIGLTMAIELRKRGFSHITISAKDRYDIPSWNAGGSFISGTGSETAKEDKERVRLAMDTFAVLQAVERGEHAYLTPAVVQRMPVYYPATIEYGTELLEKMGLMPASELVTLDFGNGVVHTGYKKQISYFINITEVMKQLWATVDALGIPVVDEEIAAFSECAESIIFNCTGLGSRTLNNDTKLYPARGHFFILKAEPGQKQRDYMLFTKVVQGLKREILYFFPKPAFVSSDGEVACAGMLGGTFIASTGLDEQAVAELDEVELQKLAERARLFFTGNK